ncbi:hypothetical protein [uncultured Methanoregula sp.]|uniref:hypothetical protein n=1 Tax=uncultured Methanoregula sp. TaxID=1005933 RepID=UPI002AAB4E11|nr:hypothetical protein [uncultured Methanoregula sp.]
MDRTMQRCGLVFFLLLISMLVIAGCASVPAPGGSLVSTPSKTTAPTPAPASLTPSVTTAPPLTLRTIVPATTSTPLPPVTTPPAESRYVVKTCAELGGFIANPGERCPGVWQDSTEAFSCCSAEPVPNVASDLSVTVLPLDLRVNLADYPGSIIP